MLTIFILLLCIKSWIFSNCPEFLLFRGVGKNVYSCNIFWHTHNKVQSPLKFLLICWPSIHWLFMLETKSVGQSEILKQKLLLSTCDPAFQVKILHFWQWWLQSVDDESDQSKKNVLGYLSPLASLHQYLRYDFIL